MSSALRILTFGSAVIVAGVLLFWIARDVFNTEVVGNPVRPDRSGFVDDISHGELDRLLATYVNERGQVRYREWVANADDLRALHDYLERLSLVGLDENDRLKLRAMDADLGSHYRLAFWINAHNALALQAILEVYPTATVRRHTNPLGFDMETHVKLLAGGQAFSLRDIRDRLLTGERDPRVRFALCRGSIGCPRLSAAAWTIDDIEQRLDKAAGDYLNRHLNGALDQNGTLHLPRLLDPLNDEEHWTDAFSWIQLGELVEDVNVRNALRDMQRGSWPAVQYLRHDWSLNDRK